MKIIENSSSRVIIEESGNKIMAFMLIISSIASFLLSFWLYEYLNISDYDLNLIFDFGSLEVFVFNIAAFYSVAALFGAHRELRHQILIDFNGDEKIVRINQRSIISSSEKLLSKKKIQNFHVKHSSRLAFPYFFSAREDLWTITITDNAGSEYILYAAIGLLAERDLIKLYQKMCSLIGWEMEESIKENNKVNCPGCKQSIPVKKSYCPYCGYKVPEQLGKIKYLE